jgi:hypothetical protein
MRMTVLGKAACAIGLVAVFSAYLAPAQAIVTATSGEALLVPLAVFGKNAFGEDRFNTYVIVSTPSSVGKDTIVNGYTAPNTTSGGSYRAPGRMTVHWYFFDPRSLHRRNGSFTMTPDDVFVFDWREQARGGLENQPGYLVFATEGARDGGTADFVLAANALFTLRHDMPGEDLLLGENFVSLPVLPLADGADTRGVGPRLTNEVVYDGDIPTQVSPLASGQRLSNGDGDEADRVEMDLPFAVGDGLSTLMVVWLDRNYGHTGLTANIFDDDENSCSASISLPDELNILYAFRTGGVVRLSTQPFDYTANPGSLPSICSPGAGPLGFVNIRLPEGTDEGPGVGATSAGVAFSIVIKGDAVGAGLPDSRDAVFLEALDRAKQDR